MSLLFPRLAFPDDRPALTIDPPGGEPETLSYRALAGHAAAHLAWLHSEGIGPGSRVGVWAAGDLESMVALVAHALGGITSVTLNPKIGIAELEHIVHDARLEHVLASDGITVTMDHARAIGRPPKRLAPLTSPAAAPLPRATVDESLALVLYTSGTTGRPKGAAISRRAIAANLDGLARAWEWTDADTVVHALPLFHVHGLVLGLFGALRVGGGFRYVPRFDAAHLARSVGTSSSAMLFAVPTMHHRLAEAAESEPAIGEALGRARLLISGSAGLPLREHRRIAELTGKGVHERYGLTETLINCAVPARGEPQPGYVGAPVRGVELDICADDGSSVPHDDTTLGEVVVRGTSLFSGYLRDGEPAPLPLDERGFFRTGDLGARRSDGSVRLVGRRSVDLIKTGGFKVGAGEVEAILLEHPAVAEAAVVGMPDDDLGQRIEAFLVLRAGARVEGLADTLVQTVVDALASHKRPRAVHFVGTLPRNAMGKVQKKRLLPS